METEGTAPSDIDVDECIIMLLAERRDPQTYDQVHDAVSGMVNGYLTHKHLTMRMLDLRSARMIALVKHRVGGKGTARSCYCLPQHVNLADQGGKTRKGIVP
jgi:hypothetical protein